jgi:hypothetical protein
MCIYHRLITGQLGQQSGKCVNDRPGGTHRHLHLLVCVSIQGHSATPIYNPSIHTHHVTYTHTDGHTYMSVRTYIHAHKHTCTWAYMLHTYTHTHVQLSMYRSECTHTYMQTHTRTVTHTHSHTHFQWHPWPGTYDVHAALNEIERFLHKIYIQGLTS